MSHKVLLVEDMPSMQMVVQSLIGDKCHLTCVSDLKTAEKELVANSFSLVLLDVDLPDGDGFQFCEKLRASEKFRDMPIIFLTGKDQVEDRVKGFRLGGDDYVTKPLEPKEFIARFEAKLRTTSRAPQTIIQRGAFRLDTTAQKAYLKNEARVEADLGLTPIEYKLLAYFIKNEGRVFAREEIKTSVWGAGSFVSDHTLDTHIYSTRKKMAPYGKCLKAIVKQGYTFSLPAKSQ